MNKDYSDIINLPHHISTKHKQMSIHDRSAQFSSFAALTGHKESINEEARYTQEKIELSQEQIEMINYKILQLKKTDENTKLSIVYFLKDDKKEGGKYLRTSKILKKIDESSRELVFTDESRVKFEDIYEIDMLHE